MVIWHPHAAYTTMALMHTATMTVRGTPLTWFTCVAPVLFTIPGLREALLLLNARSCDPKVVEGLASRGVAVMAVVRDQRLVQSVVPGEPCRQHESGGSGREGHI